MTTLQIVNTLLVLLLPVMIWFGYPLTLIFIQRMPIHQRVTLEQFARMSACYVERQHPAAAPDKKALAMAYTSDLFRLFGLPVPHEDILEIAVGAAFYEIESNG